MTSPAAWPLWVQAGYAHLGTREQAPGDSGTILNFYTLARAFDVSHDEIAWCSAFMGACMERVGIASTRSLMARSWLNWGEELEEPEPFCVVVFSRGSDPSLGHVGIFLEDHGKTVRVLGGNQSDSVSTAEYSKTEVLGYRRSSNENARMSPVFEPALAHVFEFEGGYSEDPHDPGGPTYRGITIGTLAEWRGLALAENYEFLRAELKGLSDTEIRVIYTTRYWFKGWCDQLPPALAALHFDTCVNQGVGKAAELLQRSVGVDVDRDIGPKTLAAAQLADAEKVLVTYNKLRTDHYRSLSTFWRFGNGWLRRADAALALAMGVLASPITPKANQPKETTLPNAETPATPSVPETKWWGESLTIWGVLITAASTVVPVLAKAWGVDITPDLIAKLGTDATLAMQAVGGLVGTVMAIWGRVKASTGLTQKPVQLKL